MNPDAKPAKPPAIDVKAKPAPDAYAYKGLTEMAAAVLGVLANLVDWKKANVGQQATKVISCPKCGTGKITIGLFANGMKLGHTAGQCSTPHCLIWRE